MKSSKARILLVEDDQNLGSLLKEYLIAKNYDTDLEENGEKGYKAFINNQYDICILDIMMPIKDGISLAKDIRTINSEIPILFLTAKSIKEDIIDGFKAGADDYVSKPFSMEVLLMRIEAILKRTKKNYGRNQNIFTLGQYTFDANKRMLNSTETEVKLTTKESDLLQMLCTNKNEILERNYALKKIWADDNYFNARSMDVYITKLRKLLKDEPSIEIINVHGQGFKLTM